MERKTLKLEIKGLEEPGTFTGYVAVTGNKDLGGDIIEPGAFSKTLKDHDGKVILLDGHDSWSGHSRLGLLHLSEDGKGLKVDKGVLNLDKPSAQEAYADLKFYHENGLPLGMSIGYDPIQKSYETAKDGTTIRRIKEIALWEGSLVTFPMNPKARVTGVKGWEGVASEIKTLMEELKSGRTISAANLTKLQAALEGMSTAVDQITALLELADNADSGKGAATETSHEPGPSHSEAGVKALLAMYQETRNLFSQRRPA